jgi:hypothetical protein
MRKYVEPAIEKSIAETPGVAAVRGTPEFQEALKASVDKTLEGAADDAIDLVGKTMQGANLGLDVRPIRTSES